MINYGIDINTAIKDLELDVKYKPQIESRLNNVAINRAISIYESFISNDQLKNILETQEIKRKMDCNELIAQGETNAKIELAVKLIKTGKMSIEESIIFCGLNNNYQDEIKKFLNERK